MTEPTQVPILERLNRLRTQWADFSGDADARLLYWGIEPGDERMVETFFDAEATEAGVTDDLFVRLDVPFDGGRGHGQRLVRAMTEFYRMLGDDLAEHGVDTSWTPDEAPVDDPEGAADLAAAGLSFWQHHQPLFRRLAFVLQPARVAKTEAWANWLERAVPYFVTEHVRMVVVGSADPSPMADAAERLPDAIHVVEADLRMGEAMEDVSEAAGGLDTPQGQFRHLYVQLGNALAARDMPRAEALATDALAIARDERWFHLGAAVHFAVASGWLAEQDFPRSLDRYEKAEYAAIDMIEADEEGGLTLRVKVRFGVAGVLLAAGSYDRAGAYYAETAPMAEADEDALMTMESWRMAAYAYECASDWEAAWDAGWKALDVGETMDETERTQSTLPFVGEALMRITDTYRYAPHAGRVKYRMQELLGPEWREQAQAKDAPVEPEGMSS